MTNREYIDYLMVCNGIDYDDIEKYIEDIDKGGIDIKELIKIGIDNRDNKGVSELFFSLKTLLDGLRHKKDSVDTQNLIKEIIKIYKNYVKYKCSKYSPRYFFNCMTYEVGVRLTQDKLDVQEIIRKVKTVQVDREAAFYIGDTKYSIHCNRFGAFRLYKNDKSVAIDKNIDVVIGIKGDAYKIIECNSDIENDFDLILMPVED